MKIIKYSKVSTKGSNSTVSSGGSTIESSRLDRTIWGLSDRGDDIDGSMEVNGNISIKTIIPLPDDEEGESEEYEEGGGNLDVELKITSKEVESEDIYATRHLFINYPNHPDHPSNNKKCIGEIVKTVEDKIQTNINNIKVNKDDVDTLKSKVSTNETNIKANADEIDKLKKKTDETASAVNDMMPVGSIIMFNGEADKIPDNWHICDGTNGTPNLIGKFIKADTVAGNTGGSDTIQLGISNMPAHKHFIVNDLVSSSNSSKLIPAYDELFENAYDLGGSSHYTVESGYNNKGDKGLVGIKVGDILGSKTSESGGGGPLKWSPSYYTLIFIMKIK